MPNVSADPCQARLIRIFAALCAALPAVMALAVLVGWGTGHEALTRVLPMSPRVLPNTAAMIGLGATSLAFLLACDRGPGRFASALLAFGCTALAILTLAEHAGLEIHGLDSMFFADQVAPLGMALPGRSSPHSALTAALVGFGLGIRASAAAARLAGTAGPAGTRFAVLGTLLPQICAPEFHEKAADTLSVAALVVALLGVQGNLQGVPALHSTPNAGMSLAIAVALGLLATGSLLSCKERGLGAGLASPWPGGTVLRRLLPFVIIAPTLFGWLCTEGERRGWYGIGLDMALMSTAMTLAAAPPVAWIAVSLDRAAERRQAYETERRKAETEFAAHEVETGRLRELGALKDMMLWTLSHEVKTPMSLILGYAELLEEDHPGDFRIEGILDGCKRLAAHINALLDYSALARGSLPLFKTEVVLSEIVRNSLASWAPSIHTSGIRLETSIGTDVLPVEGDARRIAEILDALVDNAIKFTPRGGTIRIEVVTCNRQSCVKVSDTGPGIDPALLGRIWEPFGKVELSPGWHGGLGLGLPLARKLVEAHGGTLLVESAKSRGSTFTVQLPAIRAEDESEPEIRA